MSSMERVVRPFQNGDVFTARVLPPVQPVNEVLPPVHTSIIGAPDTTYDEEPAPVTLGFQVEWQEDHSRRVTDQVRVENPDDPSQFVEVERIKSTVFKNSKTGEELPLKLDWR